jgi:hypothetical protein
MRPDACFTIGGNVRRKDGAEREWKLVPARQRGCLAARQARPVGLWPMAVSTGGRAVHQILPPRDHTGIGRGTDLNVWDNMPARPSALKGKEQHGYRRRGNDQQRQRHFQDRANQPVSFRANVKRRIAAMSS